MKQTIVFLCFTLPFLAYSQKKQLMYFNLSTAATWSKSSAYTIEKDIFAFGFPNIGCGVKVKDRVVIDFNIPQLVITKSNAEINIGNNGTTKELIRQKAIGVEFTYNYALKSLQSKTNMLLGVGLEGVYSSVKVDYRPSLPLDLNNKNTKFRALISSKFWYKLNDKFSCNFNVNLYPVEFNRSTNYDYKYTGNFVVNDQWRGKYWAYTNLQLGILYFIGDANH